MRAGTIVASNYFEMARLLGDSFLAAHPGDTFVILVVDDLPVTDDESDLGGIEIMRLSALDIDADELARMKTIYDVMELSTAVKPKLLKQLLVDDDLACYIDPDIYVYAGFTDLVESARDVGIALTPHVLQPIPRDGLAISEKMIMFSGIFNLGFIAVGRPAGAFLDWWHERLVVDAISDVENALFTDQRWIDWVPALFDHHICRDPGMNIAWWNIHERTLEHSADGVLANGSAIRFIHFSGYDPSTPDTFSKHQVPVPRTEHSEGLVIRELADAYGVELLARGHVERKKTPYQWNVSDDGVTMTSVVRRVCRRELLGGAGAGCDVAELNLSMPVAFGGESGAFRRWITASEPDATFSRVEVELWETRPDLRAAFPDRDGGSAADYRNWLDNDPSVPDTFGGIVDPDTHGSNRPERASPSPTVPSAATAGPLINPAHPVVARVRSIGGRVLRRVGLR